MDLSRFLSVRDVQRELRLSTVQVLQLVSIGELPAIRVFGEWRIERVMLDLFIERRYVESQAGRDDPAAVAGAAAAAAPDDPAAPGDPAADPGGTAGGAPPAVLAAGEQLGHLTSQQRRILSLLASGMSNAEIARSLTVEVCTVKTHVSRLLLRFGVRDREQLIAYLWRHGMVQADPPRD